jgi:glycosyltransferase involved in cell wall biosynthesis
MAVVRRYARRLEADGMRCDLVVCAPKAPVPVGLVALAEARGEGYDVAIATWWTTAEALFDVDAARRIIFLQSLEHRFYRPTESADRIGALGVLDLPVEYVAIGSHMSRLLERLRPDARCHLVPNGIDKTVFASRGAGREPGAPLRVLVEGQPTLWFKGIRDAVAAVRAMSEPATLTLVMQDPDDAGGVDVDRVVGGLSPVEMAELYASHDVLVKLSRLEGLSLPPLEAMHVGVPSVLTPFTGSDDYARHGENALVVGFDDHPGTVAALDLLARDELLRRNLAEGALATAASWPDADTAAEGFAAAVQAALDDPMPGADLRRLGRGRRLAVELAREAGRRDAVALEHMRQRAEFYRGKFEEHLEIAASRLVLIDALASSRSHRAAQVVKRFVPWQDRT